jgi:hypothetical protein
MNNEHLVSNFDAFPGAKVVVAPSLSRDAEVRAPGLYTYTHVFYIYAHAYVFA